MANDKLEQNNQQDQFSQSTTEEKMYHPSDEYRRQAHISSFEEYERIYRQSIEDPVKFWRDIALSEFYWHLPPSEKNFMQYNFDPSRGNVKVEWMRGAKTNICYNAVDRIIDKGNGKKIAYIWEGNEPGEEKQITYQELKVEVSKFANVLKSYGIQKGSRVAIYMPVTIELVIAMLGCARIGAIHTVVFAGFSADALADRMIDAKCSILVTADGYYRGNKLIQLKEIAADAMEKCYTKGDTRIHKCIVHRRINLPVIVTGNGSILKSHIPNGKPLIRKQTGQSNVTSLMQNNRLANNNNINNSNIAALPPQTTTATTTTTTSITQTTNENSINNNNIPDSTSTTTSTIPSVENQTTTTTNNHVQITSNNNNISNNNNNINNNNNNNNNQAITNPTLSSTTTTTTPIDLLVQQEQCPLKAISWNYAVDVWWDKVMAEASGECEPVWVDAEDPLFILYTSGSTGKPKGVVHTTGGYMIYAATTFKYVFNYKDPDVFFCTADLGWITGHTVNVYGALCNGTTITLFEGTPFYPNPGRLWEIVDRHRVNTFYTAPTAIRSLMKFKDGFVTKWSRSSLKLLGTAGEPINPEAWNWYFDVVGSRQCPIVDTFWQTETSAPMLTPLPGATALKPGSATFPFFGVQPAILGEDGKELEGPAVGHLVFKAPWPGMMRTIDGDHGRFEETYFSEFPGYYSTGDHVKRDSDGYYWVLGRADDMLNVSGHLLSTAEVESALMEHRAVVEAAAVSFPHEIKGQALFCYVVLKDEFSFTKNIESELRFIVRHKIGPLASPDQIKCLKQLPKTRSGKTMRRILRKASINDFNLGDISTIADQSALFELFPQGFKGTCEHRIQA